MDIESLRINIRPYVCPAIELTQEDVEKVQRVAEAIQSFYKTHKVNAHQMKIEPLERTIMGMKGELAVARYLGYAWEPKAFANWEEYENRKQTRDVGGWIDVRSTPYLQGHLPVKSIDADHVPFVLVVVKENRCLIKGWRWSDWCKWDNFIYKDDYGLHWTTYMVPQHLLQKIETLRDHVQHKEHRIEDCGMVECWICKDLSQ